MATEIKHHSDCISMTDTLDNTHRLIIEERDSYLLFSVEFKNEHDAYFDEEDKDLIHELLETGTKQELAELLNLQFKTEYSSLVELLKEERLKHGRIK